jgi:hypothetical protein
MDAAMHRLLLVVVATSIATGTAYAEQPSDDGSQRQIAFAVNNPLGWKWSIASSVWVGWSAHHAIRANAARYRGPLWTFVTSSFVGDLPEEDAPTPDWGHTTDVGLGWVYNPRRVLDGPAIEAGLLCRFHRLRDHIGDNNIANEERHTNVYSARILAGWTWRLSNSWFVAAAIGGALGYERGREKNVGYAAMDGVFMEFIETARVSRLEASVDAYLRVGLSFGR